MKLSLFLARATKMEGTVIQASDEHDSPYGMAVDQLEQAEDTSYTNSLMRNFSDCFSGVLHSAHATFQEHDHRLHAIKSDIAELNSRILANRRNLKKRMQSAIQMSDNLRYDSKKRVERCVT
jgi:hypothetical protein